MVKRFLFISLASCFFLVSAGYILISLLHSAPPSVIVITVESLRNDLVTDENCPHLLQASRRGIRFSRHRAVSGWTGSNIVSLLTGLTPFASGVHTRGQSVAPERHLPLELLAESGYRVEGIQGFMMMDIYRHLGLTVKPETDDWLYSLSLLIQSGEPFFSWYHYAYTHLPYIAADGYESDISRELSHRQLDENMPGRLLLVQNQSAIHHNQATFVAEDIPLVHEMQLGTIREFDDWFARVWDFFINSGLQRNTILVVTADHGDGHGERGLVGHASTTLAGHLHEEIIRVPFIIWLPTAIAESFPDADPHQMTTHEDFMPTILGLLGQKPQLSLKGRNIFSNSGDSTWMGMTSSGGFAEPDPANVRYFEYGIISEPWKLLYRTDHKRRGTFRLYNLDDDPGETNDIATLNPTVVDNLFYRLAAQIETRTIVQTDTTSLEAGAGDQATAPVWLHPTAGNGVFSYDDLRGNFRLEWSGLANKEYVLQYIAGSGTRQITGQLDVQGTMKDFGKISRRYWNTWVVPSSPFRIRVSESGGGNWSNWLDLAAKP
jgi:choline-sulfatase